MGVGGGEYMGGGGGFSETPHPRLDPDKHWVK